MAQCYLQEPLLAVGITGAKERREECRTERKTLAVTPAKMTKVGAALQGRHAMLPCGKNKPPLPVSSSASSIINSNGPMLQSIDIIRLTYRPGECADTRLKQFQLLHSWEAEAAKSKLTWVASFTCPRVLWQGLPGNKSAFLAQGRTSTWSPQCERPIQAEAAAALILSYDKLCALEGLMFHCSGCCIT